MFKEQSLSIDEYCGLGEARCRLSQEQRRTAYAIYDLYCKFLESQELWDDMDCVADVLHKLRPNEWRPRLEEPMRVYVDEIQDYTDAEVAVLVMLSGPHSLFLAVCIPCMHPCVHPCTPARVQGDTAQAVEEGIMFRFEEVRQVMFRLARGDSTMVPPKPEKLCFNFRSHSGVLDVAALVLHRLSIVFPDSIDQLPPDKVCPGPSLATRTCTEC